MSTDRALSYIDLLKKGLTYRQVGDVFGVSSGAVRNVVRRHNKKQTGRYSGFYQGITPAASDLVEPESAIIPKDTRILIFDVESAPATGWYWQPKTTFIPMDNMLEDGRIICWSAKWLNGPTMFSSEWDHGRVGMLASLGNLLDQADIVVGYNSDNYDIPYVNWELHRNQLRRPSPYKSVDLIKVVRKHFRPMYKKLDFLSQQLLGNSKIVTGGMDLYRALLLGNDEDLREEARSLMRQYNKHDVVLTEDLYLDLLSWIDGHPPVRFSDSLESIVCRSCGSEDMERAGWKQAVMLRYPVYRCVSCGSYGRTTVGRERITNMHGI